MGTNFYLHQGICPHCNKPDQVTHIGKDSFGWKFSFHGYTEEDGGINLRSFDEWLHFIDSTQNCKIYNEYGIEIPKAEFFEMVIEKQSEKFGAAQCLNAAQNGDKDAQVLFGQFWSAPEQRKYYKIDKDDYSFTYREFS